MIFAVIVLAVALAGSLGSTVWLARAVISSVHAGADSRIAQVSLEGELERARFELEQTKVSLRYHEHLAGGLEELLASYLNAPVNADLDPRDVDGRVRRLAQRFAAAAAAGHVPAEHAAAVPADVTASAPDADLRSPDGVDV